MTRDLKKILKIASISAFFMLLASFAFSRSYNLVFGVKIKDVVTAGDKIIEISGNAKNAVNLTLNGREISIDLEGNFKETIALIPKYNIVSIVAEDKFGNRDEKSYQLIY